MYKIGCAVLILLVVCGSLLFAWMYDSSTPLGACVGINGMKDSTLVYEYDAGNIALGIVGIETVVLPVYVVLNALECPVRKVA